MEADDNFQELLGQLIVALKQDTQVKTLKFKKLDKNAVTPTKANPTDAGFHLTAISVRFDNFYNFWEYDTAIGVEIPEGFMGLVMARSSVSKTGQILCNGAGVIDAPYRGSIKFRFYKNVLAGIDSVEYGVVQRIGQLIIVPVPQFELEEVADLSETDRGTGGFGSTGA